MLYHKCKKTSTLLRLYRFCRYSDYLTNLFESWNCSNKAGIAVTELELLGI